VELCLTEKLSSIRDPLVAVLTEKPDLRAAFAGLEKLL